MKVRTGPSLYSCPPFESGTIVLWSLFWLHVYTCGTRAIVEHRASVKVNRSPPLFFFFFFLQCPQLTAGKQHMVVWPLRSSIQEGGGVVSSWHRGGIKPPPLNPDVGRPFSACHYWWHKAVSTGVKWDRTAVNAGARAWNMIRPPSWIEVLSRQKLWAREGGGGSKRLSGITFISCHPLTWQCRHCVSIVFMHSLDV